MNAKIQTDLTSFDRGTNANRVDIGPLTLYFSYSTVIAYRYNGKLIICKNQWGTTTGRHLNTINTDKSIRVDLEVLEKELSDLMGRIELMEA